MEEVRTTKDKYHKVRDEMEDLTESEIGDINLWMTEYVEGAFVERVKAKVEETKRNAKVSLSKTVVEADPEALFSDLSPSEFMSHQNKVAEL